MRGGAGRGRGGVAVKRQDTRKAAIMFQGAARGRGKGLGKDRDGARKREKKSKREKEQEEQKEVVGAELESTLGVHRNGDRPGLGGLGKRRTGAKQ